jgi:hypothetical protein
MLFFIEPIKSIKYTGRACDDEKTIVGVSKQQMKERMQVVKHVCIHTYIYPSVIRKITRENKLFYK